MRIKFRGPVEHSEHSPWKRNPNILADPGYANFYEIFVYFQMSNSQWMAARRKLLFSSFFPNRISSFYMPSFKFLWPAVQVFHRQIQIIHPIFDSFDKEKHLAQNLGNFASSKKGLNIIGSKMGAQQGFTFGHFFQTSISLISMLAPLCNVSWLHQKKRN